MNLVERVKNIILTPKTEWPVIDRESCVHFKTGECGLCSKVCQAGAIDYDQEGKTVIYTR